MSTNRSERRLVEISVSGKPGASALRLMKSAGTRPVWSAVLKLFLSIMTGEIGITVGDVSDVEAHVYARYHGGPLNEPVFMHGSLRGPFCETAHTLPADVPFRDLGPKDTGVARAIVPDPCVWTPELPHLYQVDVEVRQADQVIAEYHGKIGLRRR